MFSCGGFWSAVVCIADAVRGQHGTAPKAKSNRRLSRSPINPPTSHPNLLKALAVRSKLPRLPACPPPRPTTSFPALLRPPANHEQPMRIKGGCSVWALLLSSNGGCYSQFRNAQLFARPVTSGKKKRELLSSTIERNRAPVERSCTLCGSHLPSGKARSRSRAITQTGACPKLCQSGTCHFSWSLVVSPAIVSRSRCLHGPD